MLLPAPEADRAPALHCWPQSYQRTVELLCNVTVITEMQVKASVGYENRQRYCKDRATRSRCDVTNVWGRRLIIRLLWHGSNQVPTKRCGSNFKSIVAEYTSFYCEITLKRMRTMVSLIVEYVWLLTQWKKFPVFFLFVAIVTVKQVFS